MTGANVTHVTSATWKADVLDSQIPVVVDFWAEWCVPCKNLAPVLDEIAGEVGAKLKIVKVDVSSEQMLASEFGVRNIPTLLVFKGGVVQEQMVGAMSKAALMKKLGAYL